MGIKITSETIRGLSIEEFKFILNHAFDDTTDTITDCDLFHTKHAVRDFVIKNIIKFSNYKHNKEYIISNICTIIRDLLSLNMCVDIRNDKYTRNERDENDNHILSGRDIEIKHKHYNCLENIHSAYLNTFNRNYLIMFIIELLYSEYRECVDYLYACDASVPYFIMDFKKRYSKNITQGMRTLEDDITL